MPPARRLVLFSAALAVMAAILAVVWPAGTASAAPGTAAGNRVWAISSAAHDHIWADRLVSPVQHLGEPVACPFYAPGACVAPEGAGNIAYRALNSQDVQTMANGEGIVAKNPDGAWSLAEHLVRGSSRDSWANDPWISTTLDRSVAEGFNESGSKLGVVAINMDRVSSVTAEGWRIYPRLPGEAGLPYYYSIWQQEVSVFQRIPQEAIMGFVK